MKLSTRRFLIVLTSLVLLVLLIGSSVYLISDYNGSSSDAEVFVYEVIDGDTFKMSDNRIIRLLCVDTPEQGEEGYERATLFLESVIRYRGLRMEEGETLDSKDKYNRDLRFVYVQTDAGEIFVNQEIVRLGFGEFYDYQDEDGECGKKLV